MFRVVANLRGLEETKGSGGGAGSRRMIDVREPWRSAEWGPGLERRSVSAVTTSQQEALPYVQQGSLRGFSRCEVGKTRCREKPIRAHVISRVQLSHVTEGGHGKRIASRPSLRRTGESWSDYRKRVLTFDTVGMDNLLVFRGICGHHDTELFASLDKGFQPGNRKHAFMQAYRTALYQDYVYWREAERMNRLRVLRGQQRIENGGPGATFSDLELRVIIPAGVALVHRAQMGLWMNDGLYCKVAYRQSCIDHDGPAVAGAGVMRVGSNRFPVMDSMNLTVIALGPTQTIVSAVMPQRSEALLEEVFGGLLRGNSSDQKQRLSGLMLRSFPDFAMAPQQWNKQGDSWKETVWRSRIAHLTGDYEEHPDAGISLFG